MVDVNTVLTSPKSSLILAGIIGLAVIGGFIWVISIAFSKEAKAGAQKALVESFVTGSFVVPSIIMIIIGLMTGSFLIRLVKFFQGGEAVTLAPFLTWMIYLAGFYLVMKYVPQFLYQSVTGFRVFLVALFIIAIFVVGFFAPKLIPELAIMSQSIVDVGHETMSILGVG
jgi:hypothetical protein